jgi:hypothetical protein
MLAQGYVSILEASMPCNYPTPIAYLGAAGCWGKARDTAHATALPITATSAH